ncbi:Crp/Fnr family transcriptional regulator [Acidovorax sp. sic0104]|uniref:Crp/Fnr family transcriptional regulator n=1 Tax=Acidovorax sp. sic0104 TaxID=2854784 RepID=UPI001C4941B6|nr:Crp/Fnr family transcriptional regulator [Acidovorax sp. sic0104]MBV7539471.1 Crp/Fnr family transcriptional regulator [Acidovorax sp. sic0104]
MSQEPLDAFLSQSSWTASLTEDEARRVRKAITVRSYPAGTAVFTRGTPSSHWAGVMDGMLKLDNITEEGRISTFAGVPSGAWFGEGSVLKDEPRPYAVTALTDSVVALLPRAEFLRLLHESHPFALWLIAQLNARLAHYVAQVQTDRLGDTTAQVAYSLSGLFNDALFPTTARRITLSQEELGRLSGVSRQVANRALQELQDRGAIRLGYGSIEVIDLKALQAIAREG